MATHTSTALGMQVGTECGSAPGSQRQKRAISQAWRADRHGDPTPVHTFTDAVGPEVVEHALERHQRALSWSEDILALAAHDAPDSTSAEPRPSADFLQRYARIRKRAYRGVLCIAPLGPVELAAFNAGEQLGVDGADTERFPQRLRGPTNGFQERGAGIRHQMPSIGDLNRFRQSFPCCPGVGATAVAGDYRDLPMSAQPSFHGGRVAIG